MRCQSESANFSCVVVHGMVVMWYAGNPQDSSDQDKTDVSLQTFVLAWPGLPPTLSIVYN